MRLLVATVASAVGLKGHVRLKVRTDDPEGRFTPGARLLTEDGTLTIADVRRSGASVTVRFEESADRSAAEALRDTELFIETEDEAEDGEEFFYHELIGLPVTSVTGEALGTVRDVLALPAQDVIVVVAPDGEVLVPFVEQIVPEVSEDGVVVDPPGGLFNPEEAEEA
ncbi:MAG: ribosome maturation factor RimM [Bowdeniella nasicola]|nr:ribosome maturation factor RimM [Bowdeniella nasicola]